MKTQREFVTEVIAAKVASGIEKDMIQKKGFGDRIKKAGEIVLSDGVHPVSYNDFDVASGTDSERTYHVNGECACQDAVNWKKKEKGEEVKSFAPAGYCKHKLAVELWKHARAAMKELTDKGGTPHTYHRWACSEHRDLPIVCWHLPCPDPVDVVCPTCTAVNVPPHIEQIIVEEGAPTETYIVHPEDTIDPETGEILEDAPMMTTIACPGTPSRGETIKSVVNGLNGTHKPVLDVCNPVPEAVATAEEPPVGPELPPLVTEQYEEAPALTPKPMPLPEAPVSLCLTIRLPENHQITYTMRGTEDAAVLERLPVVLATLERLMHTEVDYEGNFIQRLVRAFFPKKASSYNGK